MFSKLKVTMKNVNDVIFVTCVTLSTCLVEGMVNGDESAMHFIKHADAEYPAPIY